MAFAYVASKFRLRKLVYLATPVMCIRSGGWTGGQSDFNIPSPQMQTRLKTNLCWERRFSTHCVTTSYIKLWVTVTVGRT